uniref:non-specific serine/threonine protein kinase n=1 Tax=Geotrypetes seraphini TaxID=260995 RepID=A0A6P8PPD5_GEOSA|nr:alpha-protein kinase 3 isoform X2 [Geotrypetes seraphini]
MESRRLRSHSASGNGQYYIFNSRFLNGSSNESDSGLEEEDGPEFFTRPDSRNYLLNVRPENRTTFCAIISQLTEETQPCFETTLKSRAVSKDCDVKFTCLVSGYPVPEVTWYKDDEEMDRYCGLPKYQILRNGKRHTLQLYKCSEEDAAIYQASASNNKGIVSCSGVLEVGAMTEFKIHQRWFAKLKRKAEAKMRELEQSRKRGKENMEDRDMLRRLSPERFQRKRRFSAESIIGLPTPLVEKEDVVKMHIPDPTSRLHEDIPDSMEQQTNEDDLSNGEEVTTNGYASQDNLEENGQDFIGHVNDSVEKITKRSTAKDFWAKKIKKEEEHIAARVGGVKKSTGLNPALNRPRFAPGPAKGKVQEAMEVGKSPTIEANQKNVASSVPPKNPKFISSKQPPVGSGKKSREAETSKGKESKDTKQIGSVPSQEKVNVSLRAMYFENAVSAREKPLGPGEADVRNKQKSKRWDITQQEDPPETIKAPLLKSAHEPPKPIPRRSKTQRGVKPEVKESKSAVITTTDSTPAPVDSKTKLESQGQVTIPRAELLHSLPAPETPPPSRISSLSSTVLPHSPPAETVLVCKALSPSNISALPSTKTLHSPQAEVAPILEMPLPLNNSSELSEETIKQTDLLDSVPPCDGPPFTSSSPAATLQDSPPPAPDEIKSPQSRVSEEQLACQVFSETVSREETLKKFHELEVEYQALQRAYAQLQEQLKINHQMEQDTQVATTNILCSLGDSNQGTVVTTEEAPETMEGKNKSLQDLSDEKAPVSMETEQSEPMESGLMPKHISQTPLQEEHIEYTVETSTTNPMVSPGPLMVDLVHSSKERARFEKDDKEDMDVRDKDISLLLAVECDQQGEDSSQQLETTGSDFTESILGPESQVMEEAKQVEQVEAGTGEPEGLSVQNLPSTDTGKSETKEKCLAVSHEVTNWASELGEDISKTQSGIVPSPSPASTSLHMQERQTDKMDVSGREEPTSASASQENVQPDDPGIQSVAMLLYSVKNELDSKKPCDLITPKEELVRMEDFEIKFVTQMSQDVKDDSEVFLQYDGLKQEDALEKLTSACETRDTINKASTTPSISQAEHREEVIQDDIISMDQGKQDGGLMASLKNSLLVLLNMAPTATDRRKDAVKEENKQVTGNNQDDQLQPDTTDQFPDVGIGGMLPTTSRKIAERATNTDSIQSAESMPSGSTSGIMASLSEEDMAQNVEIMQSKDLTPKVESPCLSPRIARKAAELTGEELFSSKELLHLSPVTSRKLTAKLDSEEEGSAVLPVPAIIVGNIAVEDNVMLSELQPDGNLKGKFGESTALIPSATPEELASGARRKIYLPKPKQLNDVETIALDSPNSQTHPKQESPNVSPGMSRRNTTSLQGPVSPQSPPIEKHSPNLTRKMMTLEVPKMYEEQVDKGNTTEDFALETKDFYTDTKDEGQGVESKKVNDPFKAPQVIRKIRAEEFSDVSAGNLKLWCQFFNVLSDSVITWYKDERLVAEVKKCSGDEGQVALAIVQASRKDCGVYQCTIQNVYGTDSTDFLLSAEVLSGITPRELEVGEEIEMTPMVFAKGLADSGYWGDKYFGRIVLADVDVGEGYLRKACRAKVIYGLEPMFESGKTCIIKVHNFITFGTKNENTLVEKNYDITIQECKIQNTTREYCKIFAAEARVMPDFGQVPEIIPLNLIYRPANNIPYATIEEDLVGHFERYCTKDRGGTLHMKNISEVDQKCCTFQHWVYQWTNGNFLVTVLEGVGWKITNIGIATKSRGYQGLKESCFPALLDQFTSVHQCNRYCDTLGLKSLKSADTLQQSSKPKGSKSPSMGRKSGSAQSSPQMQKKGLASPQGTRKAGTSPKNPRKTSETAVAQPTAKHKTVEIPRSVRMR